MEKEELIEIYERIKESKGEAPTQKEMFLEPGVTRFQIVKHYRTYAEMMLEMGDEPREIFKKQHTDEMYYKMYGDFVREHKRVPKFADFIFYKLRPNLECFRRRFGAGLKDLPYVFLAYAAGKPEWEDVTAMIPMTPPVKKNEKASFTGLKGSLYDRTPPILQNLKRLSFGEGAAKEFEGKCRMVFQMLGYETQELGQGAGRNPDGIARDRRNRFAIIYDAKARREHYTPGTDDRQFIEYIRAHKDALMSSGIELITFLVISSRFGEMRKNFLDRIRLETGVSVALITAENLLRVNSFKSTIPELNDGVKLKQLFATEGEISKERIEKLLK